MHAVSARQLEEKIAGLFVELCMFLSYKEFNDPLYTTMEAFHASILKTIKEQYGEDTLELVQKQFETIQKAKEGKLS